MSQARLSPVALPFPARGVNTGRGLANQPEGTCPDARNVRTLGQLEDRARGGQREGIVKAFATDTGDAPLDLNTVILPAPEGDSLPGAETVFIDVPNVDGTYTSNGLAGDDSRLENVQDVGTSSSQVGTAHAIRVTFNSTTQLYEYLEPASGSSNDRGAFGIPNVVSAGSTYEVRMTVSVGSPQSNIAGFPIFGMASDAGMFIRANANYRECMELSLASFGGGGTTTVFRLATYNSSNFPSTLHTFPNFDSTNIGLNFPLDELTLILRVEGDTITAFIDGDGLTQRYEIGSHTTTTFNTNSRVGAGIERSVSTNEVITRFQVLGTEPAPFGRRRVYVISQVPDKVYVGQLSNDTTQTMDEVTGGAGTPLAKTSNTASASLFNKLYAVNGTNGVVIDPEALTVEDWDATAGVRPNGYLCEAFRGSAVIAADPSDPNNLYMSAVEDPLDWDYGADPIETSAFALDSSDLGKNADPIIALATWSDDFMLIGGASSLRVMSGDPRAGGRLDTITLSLGVIGPRAMAVSPNGQLYFVGNDGLYRMPFNGTVPEPISRGRLDSLLKDINLDEVTVECVFNSQANGVHIWLTSTDADTLATHVFYSIGDDAFWVDELPAATMDPTATVSVFGNETDLRNIIIGSRDGFLRRFDQDANDDDGTAMASWVRYAPILAGGGMSENVIRELQLEMGRGADAVAWTLRAADSAEDLDDDNAVRTRTGTTIAGRAFQTPQRLTLRYAAMQLELRNDTAGESWAVERALMRERPGGRRRG